MRFAYFYPFIIKAMLRQPLEAGEVTISRVKQAVTYPCRFILIAATNPCPCGYAGSNERYCTCTPKQVTAYQLKASGPLLDRLDFVLSLKSIGLAQDGTTETSEAIRYRTSEARAIQRNRYGSKGLNGTIPFQLVNETCGLTEQQLKQLQQMSFDRKWSNRTQTKIIRIARTIADLAGHEMMNMNHLNEAIQWKSIASNLQDTFVAEKGDVR